MHHLFRTRRRGKQQSMNKLETDSGVVLRDQQDISAHLLHVYTNKFAAPMGPPPPPSAVEHLEKSVTQQDNDILCQPISIEELTASVMASPRGKSPGLDGIVAELYREFWPLISSAMHEVVTELWENGVPEEMLRGVVVFIPKKKDGKTVKDYRPLTLLNCDLKLYARVLATRLARLQDKLLHPSQVRPGGVRNMTAALCDLRDVISYLDNTKSPGCVLTIDLASAFDCVKHDFMLQVLRRRGLDPRFIQVLRPFYGNATSQLRVNGRLTSPFRVMKSMRQGCPMSMLMFSVCLSPLVTKLHMRLEGVVLVDSCIKVSTYADDMYSILRSHHDAMVVSEELGEFGDVSGLCENKAKSAALPVSRWDTNVAIGYKYVDHCKVLGVVFARTISKTISMNWPQLVTSVRGILIDSCNRNLTLTQRVYFASTYGLSKIWHVAQVVPLSQSAAKGLVKTVARFLWRGSLFRVPMEVATRPRTKGGLALPDIRRKCTALLVGRWHGQLAKDPGAFCVEWLQYLQARFPPGNPPVSGLVWAKAAHYRPYLETAAYGGMPQDVTGPRDIYSHLSITADERRPPARVVRQRPECNWAQVWANVNNSVLPVTVRDAWYCAVHDLVCTRVRLSKVGQENSAECPRCEGVQDTLQHRLSECADSDAVWGWLKRLLGCLTGINFEPGIMLRPDFKVTEPKRHAAAVWAVGHTVAYLAGGQRTLAYEFARQIEKLKAPILSGRVRAPQHLVEGLQIVNNIKLNS